MLFLLDEMAQLKRMDPLKDALSIIRGFGGTIWTILQDISQIKEIYPEDGWKQFISTSTVQQYFGINDPDTAEYVSKILGNTTVEVTSYSEGTNSSHGSSSSTSYGANGSSSSGSSSSFGSSSGTSTTEQLRPLLRPEELLRMPPDEQIVIARGKSPIWGKKIADYRDPEFAELYDPNPQQQPTR